MKLSTVACCRLHDSDSLAHDSPNLVHEAHEWRETSSGLWKLQEVGISLSAGTPSANSQLKKHWYWQETEGRHCSGQDLSMTMPAWRQVSTAVVLVALAFQLLVRSASCELTGGISNVGGVQLQEEEYLAQANARGTLQVPGERSVSGRSLK